VTGVKAPPGALLLAAIAAVSLPWEAPARADGDRPVATESGEGPFRIVDRPITFDAEREQLTLDYRRAHTDPAAKDIQIEPRMVVLHFTAGGSAKGTIGYFDNVHLEKGRKKLHSGGELNVSAHFVVDRDGTIYRLMPETRMARHCIGLNHVAIGIENVGDGKRWPLTDAQVKANAALVRYLAGRFPITHLIGHSEYRAMEGHPYFVERDPAYRNQKPDPGDAFLKAVRAEVADLKLSGPPDKPAAPPKTTKPKPKPKQPR
jgi:N-acetylmuramoyl-L-alanine amidase-like protein